LGKDAGTNNNTVIASGVGTPVTFNASGTPGAAANIITQSATSQSATVTTNVAAPPSVLITDSFGNPVAAGVTVIFTIANGANGGLVDASSASTQHTNAAGLASVASWTLGQDVGTDNNTINVTSPGVTVTNPLFTASGLAAQISVSTQPDAAGGPGDFSPQPVIQVLDANNNPMANVTVTVSIEPTSTPGASLTGTVTAVTGPTGLATYVGLGINQSGTYTLRFTTSFGAFVLSNLITVP
jgi:hypothetical protein